MNALTYARTYRGRAVAAAGGTGCVSARLSGDSSPLLSSPPPPQLCSSPSSLFLFLSGGSASRRQTAAPLHRVSRRVQQPPRVNVERRLPAGLPWSSRSSVYCARRRSSSSGSSGSGKSGDRGGKSCRSGAQRARKNGENQVPRRCHAPWSLLRALTRPPSSPALRAAGSGDRRGTPRYAGGIERRPRASASAIALPLRATRVRPSLCRCASTQRA